MKRVALTLIFTLFFMAKVVADPVGLYLGGQAWQSQASGALGEQSTLINFDLAQKLQGSYFVAIEHPFFLLPNIRIARFTLNSQGNTDLMQDFAVSHAAGVYASTDFSSSYVDYTLYYELFDNDLFAVELGVTARDINVDVSIEKTALFYYDVASAGPLVGENCRTGDNPRCEFYTSLYTPEIQLKAEETQPMLYANTSIGLPLSGLTAFLQGNVLLASEHSLYNYQLGLSYAVIDSMLMDLNLTLGYQSVQLEFEDLNRVYTDLAFTGVFFGAVLHF